MKLKVITTEGQKVDYLLMSAGSDGMWNTPDDVMSRDLLKPEQPGSGDAQPADDVSTRAYPAKRRQVRPSNE